MSALTVPLGIMADVTVDGVRARGPGPARLLLLSGPMNTKTTTTPSFVRRAFAAPLATALLVSLVGGAGCGPLDPEEAAMLVDEQAETEDELRGVRYRRMRSRRSRTIGGTVKVYRHCGYRGRSATLGLGSYTKARLRRLGVRDNDISSLRFSRNSMIKVTLFEHDNFQGRSWWYTTNVRCLVSTRNNDVASSIKVEMLPRILDRRLRRVRPKIECPAGPRNIEIAPYPEAFAAWNASGSGPEAAATGPAIPEPFDACYERNSDGTPGARHEYNRNAYHYVASYDHLSPGAPGAGHLVDSPQAPMTGLPRLRFFLGQNGYTAEQIDFRFGALELQHYSIDEFQSREERRYEGGVMGLYLDDHLMVSCPMPETEIIVQYVAGGGSTNFCDDDVILAVTEPFAGCTYDASASAPRGVRAAASALMQDIDECGEFKFLMDSMQQAGQTEFFTANGRTGAVYAADRMRFAD